MSPSSSVLLPGPFRYLPPCPASRVQVSSVADTRPTIQDWHGIFLRFDRDNSGTIDRKELHAALLGFGFSLPPEMVRRLEKKFAPPLQPGQEGSHRKGISFDRFLLACVTVKHYTEAFRRYVPPSPLSSTPWSREYGRVLVLIHLLVARTRRIRDESRSTITSL